MLEIEATCASFGVYHDGPGGNLVGTAPSSLQSIEQEELSQAKAMQRLFDRHPPEQRHGKRKPRKALRQFWRQIGGQGRVRGESVETGNCLTIRSENEDGGKFALLVLASVPLNVGIQFGNPTTKVHSVMIRSECLDAVIGCTHLRSHCLPVRSL